MNPTLAITSEPHPDFRDPDTLIRPFEQALEAMRHSHQKMTVELQLPAHLWLMLAHLAWMRTKNGMDTIGAIISDLLFRSAELRADWMETDWEAELLPEVLRQMFAGGKLPPKVREEIRKAILETKGGAQ